jgi:hypothetical protein
MVTKVVPKIFHSSGIFATKLKQVTNEFYASSPGLYAILILTVHNFLGKLIMDFH